MKGLLGRLRQSFSRLRMRSLGYRYDYDRTIDERIVATIREDMGDDLNGPDDERRRLARTIAQYRAQLAMRPRTSLWVFEIASLFALPLFLAGSWIAYRVRGASKHARTCDGLQLVFANRWRDNPEIFAVPDDLKDRSIETECLTQHRLSNSDVRLVAALLVRAIALRVAFPFQLVLKCSVDIAAVRAALTRSRPRFILVYWEFSCSLSAIVQAIGQDGIETYNIMHGDKHYYAKHAFFEVDRCYCWNTFYIDIFQEEHVRADFRVFTNPGFVLSAEEESYCQGNAPTGIGIAAPHIATLSDRNGNQKDAADQFANAVNALAINHPVTIRPHPFYTREFDVIRSRLSSRVTIEHPTSKSARMFLLDYRVIVGTVSTLLLEAAHLGCKVVILSTSVMKNVESYHYLYKMENVFTSTLDTLTDTIATIDAGVMDEQTAGMGIGTADTAAIG